MKTYLETAKNVYKDAAITPDVGLCCTTTPVWQFPELNIPSKMLAMNYGCGSTVNPRDLVNDPSILYVGVGGGMELLQFSYFSRKKAGVIGLDVVDEMIDVCKENLIEAETQNNWFSKDFVEVRSEASYSKFLEYGTSKMLARPFMFPASEKSKPKIAEILFQKIKQSLDKFGK